MTSMRTRARRDGWDHADCDLEFALTWGSVRYKDPDLIKAFTEGWHERRRELRLEAHQAQQKLQDDEDLVERLWPLFEAKLIEKGLIDDQD